MLKIPAVVLNANIAPHWNLSRIVRHITVGHYMLFKEEQDESFKENREDRYELD